MEIQTISVKASRTLPHPTEAYANYKTEVSLCASLGAGDVPADCVRELQGQAECLVEQHATELRTSIMEFQRVITARQQVAKLEHQIAEQQDEIERLRVESERGELPLFRGSRS